MLTVYIKKTVGFVQKYKTNRKINYSLTPPSETPAIINLDKHI